MNRTRKWWMLLVVVGLLAALLPVADFISPAYAANETVHVWMTTSDQTKLLAPQPDVTFAPDSGANPYTIDIDETQVYQQIDGFGGTLSDGPAWLIANKLNASQRSTLMNNFFNPTTGIGLSFLRQPIGANDLALSAYTYDDKPAGQTDPTLASFSIAHDSAYIIPLLQQALQLNPKLKIMATPWGVPGWMKTNGQLNGGGAHVSTSAYGPLANYFVKYVQAYQAQGLPIYAVSPNNEPQYDSTGYPSVLMSAPEARDFIKNNLGPAFASANITTKILMYDHNWNDASGPPANYPQQILADASANGYVAGTAWHCYGGDVAMQTAVRMSYPNKETYETECAGGTWEGSPIWPNALRNTMGLMIDSTRNWSRTVVRYALALDTNNGPYLSTPGACSGCRGLVTIDQSNGNVAYNADYYALGHVSKFVIPGAYRIGSTDFDTSTISNVNVTGAGSVGDVAFRNPDGSKVLVVFNGATSANTFKVKWGTQAFSYTLPAGAAATFTWTGIPSYITFDPTHRIEAEFANAQNSTQNAPANDDGGGVCVGYTSNGSWLKFSNVDFGSAPGASQIQARVAQDASAGGGSIEFHVDSPTGTTIGSVSLGGGGTGGWQNWQTVSATVVNASGIHDLYAVFRASINLNWLSFTVPQSAYNQIEAEAYNAQSGNALFTAADTAYPTLGAGWNGDGSYLRFNSVNFGTGASTVQARVVRDSGSGNLELHLDSLSGTLIGTLSVGGTGGWQSWQTLTTSVSNASGVHDLYVVFRTSINLNWVTFATAVDDSVQGTGNNQFNYIGSGWGHCTNCDGTNLGMYSGSNSWDGTANDYATVAFSGTKIWFYGCVGPGHGIAAFSIDGGVEAQVDFYAPSDRCNQLLWSSFTLSPGSHTFKVRVTGNKRTNATWNGINPDRVAIAP